MNWFIRGCRQTGLLLHELFTASSKQQVSHKVEEKKVNENVTLRRTTIEEIEIRKTPDDAT